MAFIIQSDIVVIELALLQKGIPGRKRIRKFKLLVRARQMHAQTDFQIGVIASHVVDNKKIGAYVA